jgi:hypothetical protein
MLNLAPKRKSFALRADSRSCNGVTALRQAQDRHGILQVLDFVQISLFLQAVTEKRVAHGCDSFPCFVCQVSEGNAMQAEEHRIRLCNSMTWPNFLLLAPNLQCSCGPDAFVWCQHPD